MTDDKASEARKGLFDSVKGKAKEVAGAITGNDSLTAEGQLEQTQAAERREANADQAVADAEADQAAAVAREAQIDGAKQRGAVEKQTAAVEHTIDEQKAEQKKSAEQAAQRDITAAQRQAEAGRERDVALAEAKKEAALDEAADEHADAIVDYADATADAAAKKAEADKLRQEAQKAEGI